MSGISVIGAGAWGSALALLADRAGHRVTLWARDPAPIHATGRSPRLPGVDLPPTIRVTGNLAITGEAEAILLVVPVAHLRAIAAGVPGDAPLVICAKGLEPGSRALPAEILAELHPGRPVAVLSGPNFAAEIAAGLPAAAIVAAADPDLRTTLIDLLSAPNFRLYGNDDPLGAQLGGAAKNVIAIAAGAVTGAGLGENARAALVTRGVAELARLVAGLGGRAETAYGLSGLGDLLLTCTGAASRNHALGIALGQGQTLADILAARSTAIEGVGTAPALVARAAHIDLPICTAVADLLAGRLSVTGAMASLLARPRRDE
jgi:glycerol-3-phosphate dehydrogenase (NAD(P)+)